MKSVYSRAAACTLYLQVCHYTSINSIIAFFLIIFHTFAIIPNFSITFVTFLLVLKTVIIWKIVWKSVVNPGRGRRPFALSSPIYETSARKEPQKEKRPRSMLAIEGEHCREIFMARSSLSWLKIILQR